MTREMIAYRFLPLMRHSEILRFTSSYEAIGALSTEMEKHPFI